MLSTLIKAKCHCGTNVFQVPFKNSELPIAPVMCHCNSCRHITGQLLVHAVTMDGIPLSIDSDPNSRKPGDLSRLKIYTASERIKRYFCPICSAYLFYETNGPNKKWMVSTGALESVEGIVKVGYHLFVADTLDGGLADRYVELDGAQLPRYAGNQKSQQLPLGWKSDKLSKGTASNWEYLPTYCHCKATSLHLTRLGTDEANDPNKWWAVPMGEKEHAKFKGNHCVCTSCRTSSGSLIQSWIIIPRTHIIDAHTSKPVSLSNGSNRPRGLVQYESSPGTYRESCGTCGANVFWWSTNKASLPPVVDDEPVVIAVGAGMIDQEVDGARAEAWVLWNEAVAFPEDAIDKTGLKALEMGLKGG